MRRPLLAGSQIVSFLLIPVMLVSIWLHIQVLDSHRYTESMRSLGSDASFREAFGDQVSRMLNDEITKLSSSSYAVLAEQYVNEAGGIEVVQATISGSVASLIQSPLFVQYWVQLNQATHQQVVDFFRGEASVLVSENRRGISLDLATIASWVDPFVDGAASEALALATSDGVGQIPIAESRSFPLIEWISRNSVPVAIGSVAVFLVLQTLAIVYAMKRKQAVIIAAVGIVIAAGVTVLAAKTLATNQLSKIRDVQGRALAREYIDAVMSDLVVYAVAVGVAALLVGAVLAAMPYIRQDRVVDEIGPVMPQS